MWKSYFLAAKTEANDLRLQLIDQEFIDKSRPDPNGLPFIYDVLITYVCICMNILVIKLYLLNPYNTAWKNPFYTQLPQIGIFIRL